MESGKRDKNKQASERNSYSWWAAVFAFVDFVSISITETGSRNWSVRAVLVTQQECKVKDLKCTPDFDAFTLKPIENSSQAIWLLCDR